MISNTTFYYRPNESELERASNSYLMSLVAVIGGLPLPILNLLHTKSFISIWVVFFKQHRVLVDGFHNI